MGKTVFNEKTPRKFQVIEEPGKLAGLIQKYFIQKPYFVAGDVLRQVVTAGRLEEGNRVVLNSKVKLTGVEKIYTVLSKYIDFICSVEKEIMPDQYLVQVESCRVALETRKDSRFPADSSKVFISNIRASRNTINASLFNIPTSVKVHFKQYQHELAPHFDEVVVDVYDKSSEKHDLVRRSGKVFYVADTRIPSSFSSARDDFIDYAGQSTQEVSELMREYRTHKVVSEMIIPVIYKTLEEQDIPLGYIQLISKKEPIPEEKAAGMIGVTHEMVKKMRDSNMIVIKERQEVENISHEGLRLRITHEELKKLLPMQDGVTFDLIFKMTQPITLSTEIVYSGIYDDDLILGLKVIGHSSKTGDFSRYYSLVDSMAR